MARRIKVALVMGGGVSLGSFSGGALGRCIEILHHLASRPDRSVEIDVLAGASAGGMSLTLALRALLSAGAGPDRVAALGHRAWVEQISMRALARNRDEEDRRSLLDRGVVDEISTTHLRWRAGERAAWSPLFAERVLLLHSLNNLTGLASDGRQGWEAYLVGSARPAFADALHSHLHRDRRIFEFHRPGPTLPVLHPQAVQVREEHYADNDLWRRIAGTAVACGAFPIAFAPVPLQRDRDEYPEHLRRGGSFPDEAQHRLFLYSDGGMFDNEPIGQALDLCRRLDHDLPADTRRLVVLIDPSFAESRPNDPQTLWQDQAFSPDPFDTSDMADDLVVPVTMLDRLMASGAMLAGAAAGQAQLKPWLQDLDGADPWNGVVTGWSPEQLRLLAIGPLAAADGGATAPERRIDLHGARLANFKGFLDQRYRQHDHDVGRWAADHYLRELDGLEADDWQGLPGIAGPPTDRAVPTEDADDYPVLKDLVRKLIDGAASDLGLPFVMNLVPVPFLPFLLKSAVGRMATDRLLQALERNQDRGPWRSLPVQCTITGFGRGSIDFVHLDPVHTPVGRLHAERTTISTVLRLNRYRLPALEGPYCHLSAHGGCTLHLRLRRRSTEGRGWVVEGPDRVLRLPDAAWLHEQVRERRMGAPRLELTVAWDSVEQTDPADWQAVDAMAADEWDWVSA